jgi:amino acid permease
MFIILKCLILGWFVNNFQPIKTLFAAILGYNLRPIFKFVITMLLEIISCQKCATFWVCLIYTGDIFLASFCAFLALLYTNRLKCYEEYIKI